MPGQYTRGIVSCQVRLSAARADKLEDILDHVPERIRLSNSTWVEGTKNRNTLIVDAEYGPVAGAWESDIRKAFQVAMKNVGTTARLDIDNLQRTVVGHRKPKRRSATS